MAISPELETLLIQQQSNSQQTAATLLQCSVLCERSLLSCHGPDAQKFLQGQLSCDLNTLAHTATRGAHCTPKGRAIASFYISAAQEQQYLMALPSDNVAALQQSLGKYIVFSKAQLEVLTDWLIVGISGSEANTWAKQTSLPEGVLVKIADNRYQCWLPQSVALQHWATLFGAMAITPAKAWHYQELQQFIVDIDANTREVFIPQMFGLYENHGISYKKGCYTGQEIIARLHFLGQQKRSLFQFSCSRQNTTLASGSDITNTDGKVVGTLAAVIDDLGLAVLGSTSACGETLYCGKDELLITAKFEPEAS